MTGVLRVRGREQARPLLPTHVDLDRWPRLTRAQPRLSLGEWRRLFGTDWWQPLAWLAHGMVVPREQALIAVHRGFMAQHQCHILGDTEYCFCERAK